MNSRINSMIKISVMTVLIIICSLITVPFAVPFTMQTFAICFSLLYLGGLKGSISVALYLLMGCVGIPCFSGFSGGIGHLLGPTGGFLTGFLIMSLFYWAFERLFLRKRSEGTFRLKIVALAIGLIVCYGIGTCWFVLASNLGFSSSGIGAALLTAVVPFIFPDALKVALSVYLYRKITKITGHE